MTGRVTIGFAHPGEVRTEFFDSVMRVLLNDGALPPEERRIMTEGAGYLQVSSGPRIAAARNTLVENFLSKQEAEWLWMLDADMSFSPNTLEVLLGVADPFDRPVVGALCFGGGRGRIFPTMYQIVDPDENEGFPVKHITEWPEHAVVEVDATGAACLLIHRSVLEEIGTRFGDSPTPWFHESVYKGKEFGEDWTFCLKVRALGHPIYVATDAKTGHVKTVELNEELWRTGKVPLQWVGGIPREQQATAKHVELATPADVVRVTRQQRRELARRGG